MGTDSRARRLKRCLPAGGGGETTTRETMPHGWVTAKLGRGRPDDLADAPSDEQEEGEEHEELHQGLQRHWLVSEGT